MDDQISILEEFDLREEYKKRMQAAKTEEKIRRDYVRTEDAFGNIEERIPAGIVLIIKNRNYPKDPYYRVVTGYHKTVSGPALHLISSPNPEWPAVPKWGVDKSRGIQWVYANSYTMFVKREPETETPVWNE